MRNTAGLAALIAEHFLIGTGLACVLITAEGAHCGLTVDDARAHSATERQLWFSSRRLAQRALDRLLSVDRRTAEARDGLTMTASAEEAETSLMHVGNIEGLARNLHATITALTLASSTGDLKKLKRART